MTVEIDVEAITIGEVVAEIDFCLLVVRITVFELHECVFADRVFRTRAQTPAVGIDVLREFGRTVARTHVELGVGVATLHVCESIRADLGTDARAEVEVAVDVHVADADAFEVTVVEFRLGGRVRQFRFGTDNDAAHVDVVTDAHTVEQAFDGLIVVGIRIIVDRAACAGRVVTSHDLHARAGERRVARLRHCRRCQSGDRHARENDETLFHT